jgi:hypothetical protein
MPRQALLKSRTILRNRCGRAAISRQNSSNRVSSPRLDTQPLFAINAEELLLIEVRRCAMEASMEIAIQFDEQSRVTSVGVQPNRLFVQHVRSSNPVATLAGSIDADIRSYNVSLPRT